MISFMSLANNILYCGSPITRIGERTSEGLLHQSPISNHLCDDESQGWDFELSDGEALHPSRDTSAQKPSKVNEGNGFPNEICFTFILNLTLKYLRRVYVISLVGIQENGFGFCIQFANNNYTHQEE